MASSSIIPLVDLSSSQEEEIEVNGRKRKEDVVHILEDIPTRKKHKSQSAVEKNDPVSPQNGLDSILQRVETLEHMIIRTPSRHEEHKYVTREEFQDLVKEFQEIKQKVISMEKIFEAIKSAFLTSASSSSKSIFSPTPSDAGPSHVHTPTPTQQNSGNVPKGNTSRAINNSNPATQRQGGNITSDVSTPRVAIPASAARRISAPSNSSSVRKVTPPLPRKSYPSNQGYNATDSFSTNGITITPLRKSMPQTNLLSTPSQSSGVNHQRNSNIDQSTSASIPRSLNQTLNESYQEQDQSARGASNLNINDLTDDVLRNVRIKQEMLEQPQLTIDMDHTRSFRKDEDDNILVYIDGGGNKSRNQDKYIAYSGHSLDEEWVRVSIYQSDLNVARLTKNISIIKKQAEIIAAYLAIEDLKTNSTQRPLKVRIVTKTNRLVTTMTNLQKVYYCFGECMCEVLQCPHQRKWQTIDSFASDFPDDLPRLALAVSNPELIVSWRTYSAAELANKELWETFKRKFKDLKNNK